MKFNITFRHLDFSETLAENIKSKINNIGRFLLKDGCAQIEISKLKNEYCIDVSINTKEKYFKATAISFDAYCCADEVIEKLERQLLKINKINKHHKKFELSKNGKLNSLNSKLETSLKYKKAA